MSVRLYKPNSKNTGSAGNFSFRAANKGQEPLFFVSLIKQHSWDATKRTGTFSSSKGDPSKETAIMFNQFELGEIINTFRTGKDWSTYHNTPKKKSSISLTTYPKKREVNRKPLEVTAFGLSVTVDGVHSFKLPIDPGDAVVLTNYIHRYFDALHNFQDQQDQEYSEKNRAKNQNNDETGPGPDDEASETAEDNPEPEF